MTEFERRIWRQVHSLIGEFSKWWSGLRDTKAAKKATTAMHDMRESDAAKKAAATLGDLRDTEAAKRAATALHDLRQREPVRKAEESARRALHDLRSGRGTSDTTAS